ncbi:MAG TPA: TylF/MycF/NovP-related O-methyltransferase [Mycobacterium sp.]|nr:TylF/MycF/NovP-related O-methyltransferase [Mycobacterium sp.]
MSAKIRLNAVLTRLVGHHLAKGAPGELADVHRRLAATRRRLERSRTELKQARAQLREARRELRHSERQLAKRRAAEQSSRNSVRREYDHTAVEIIQAVRPYSMTNSVKLFGLIQATRYVSRNMIDGAIVECGVWRGGSMQAVARTLLDIGDANRELYLFDTFEGMTEPTEHDIRRDGRSAAELMTVKGKSSWLWAIASLEDVRDGFAHVPYREDKVHYVVGRVEETIPRGLPEHIAILRLDTDWYESTKHELEHAYSRLSPGGVLIIDDYGHWAGSRKATDDFVSALDEPPLLHRLGSGRIAIKPFHRRG